MDKKFDLEADVVKNSDSLADVIEIKVHKSDGELKKYSEKEDYAVDNKFDLEADVVKNVGPLTNVIEIKVHKSDGELDKEGEAKDYDVMNIRKM